MFFIFLCIGLVSLFGIFISIRAAVTAAKVKAMVPLFSFGLVAILWLSITIACAVQLYSLVGR